MLTYIANSNHYKEVISQVQSVKQMLWIGLLILRTYM